MIRVENFKHDTFDSAELLERGEGRCEIHNRRNRPSRECGEPAALRAWTWGEALCFCAHCWDRGRNQGDPSVHDMRRENGWYQKVQAQQNGVPQHGS